jgi:beta-lactamase regulating signal transducer with metallopeptidase domain
MLHALFISIIESAIALGLVASAVTALRPSGKARFHMWATVLLIAFAGFGASLIASHRPAPTTAPPFNRLDVKIGDVLGREMSPTRKLGAPARAANEIRTLASEGESVERWVERIWLLGALFCAARILLSVLQTMRFRRRAAMRTGRSFEVDPRVSELISGLPPKVRIVELETGTSPAFLGYGSPLIALPKRLFKDFTPDELRFIVAHEVEHWRRRDDYVDLASRLLTALLWPNPSVHLARRFMVIERECACDHAASRFLRSGIEAADCLWRSAQTLGLAPTANALAALGSSSQLVTRIRRLVAPRAQRELSRKILFSAIAPLIAMAMFVAALASPATIRSPNVDRSAARNHDPFDSLQNGATTMNDLQWAGRQLETGEIARREKRFADARADFAAAATWYATHGPTRMRVHALTRQAQIERDLGNYDAAIGFQQTALQLQREIGSDGLPHVVRHLADMLDDAGRHEDASPYYSEMEMLYRNSSSTPPLEMANAVRSLAVHAEHVGDKKRAAQLWIEARDRYSKLDQLFSDLTGEQRNPGVEEAERRLALL